MLTIERGGTADIPEIIRLFREIESEEAAEDPAAPDRVESGLLRSVEAHGTPATDSFWLLLARMDGKSVGYAAVARIPKLDSRIGFLYLDELHVLRRYRRQGVATALLEEVSRLSRELGYSGVRLIVESDNLPARDLYRGCGFTERPVIFCQQH